LPIKNQSKILGLRCYSTRLFYCATIKIKAKFSALNVLNIDFFDYTTTNAICAPPRHFKSSKS